MKNISTLKLTMCHRSNVQNNLMIYSATSCISKKNLNSMTADIICTRLEWMCPWYFFGWINVFADKNDQLKLKSCWQTEDWEVNTFPPLLDAFYDPAPESEQSSTLYLPTIPHKISFLINNLSECSHLLPNIWHILPNSSSYQCELTE